ncbi:hypothetical protein [Streptomyces shenzhenensis]|uniref:Uncharacterized protein n=1 Tax=Streptomyces shenzhenensis TaxID=943815 RepID=A0A3M0HWK2_9ACTN|nr:hypothetical protein [Streptomyces shenzhenensis]RMB80092.1 hypothetical protein CTZ28_41810 [Streptomyces shenzhenensis]
MAVCIRSEARHDESTGRRGLCSWCRRLADDIQLIQAVEAGSGPCAGGSQFACRPCRAAHRLVPLAGRP